jgi:hypothetical protein
MERVRRQLVAVVWNWRFVRGLEAVTEPLSPSRDGPSDDRSGRLEREGGADVSIPIVQTGVFDMSPLRRVAGAEM